MLGWAYSLLSVKISAATKKRAKQLMAAKAMSVLKYGIPNLFELT